MIFRIHIARLGWVIAAGALLVGPIFLTERAAAADVAPKAAYPATMISPVPVRDWTGFYVGVHGGFMGSSFKASGATPNVPQLTFPGQKKTKSVSGGAIGAQVGYNFQTGSLVYGLEGEASFSPSSGNNSVGNLLVEQQGRYALKGRLGYSFGSTLVYGTTGVAFSQARFKSPVVGTSRVTTRDVSQTGWLVGAGVEQMLTPSLSVKGEVDYASFGEKRLTFPAGTTKVQGGTLSAKVGLNYRF